MNDFTFQSRTKIVFGRGVENHVGQEVKEYLGQGGRLLLHYGGGSVKQSGLYVRIVNSLKTEGIDFLELGGVKPNPRLILVEEGIKLCRAEGIKFILAVGGGSVIDSAKAIAIGVPYEGKVWDFYERKARPQATLPVGVVLTIAAAGSEASNSSVITNEDGWLKRGLGAEITRPRFALMNPELTFTLPPHQTAAGVADIMAHIMERYFTQVTNVDLTDRLCEATLKTVIYNARIALEEPDNYDARAEIMWAGTIAHNDLLSTGREGDWASHEIEHELSGIYDVAHGAGLATVFPAWMKYVIKDNIDRFVQFAVRVWNVEYSFEWPERTAWEGIERLIEFFRTIGLPVTLTELDVPEDRLEEMAAKCTHSGPVGNFMKLNKKDVLEILRLARS